MAFLDNYDNHWEDLGVCIAWRCMVLPDTMFVRVGGVGTRMRIC